MLSSSNQAVGGSSRPSAMENNDELNQLNQSGLVNSV